MVWRHLVLVNVFACALFVTTAGCDEAPASQGTENEHSAEESGESEEHNTKHEHSSDHEEHEEGMGEGSGESHSGEHEEHHHGGIHLADIMQSVAMRFSAIWFAGKAGNRKMVDYQIVELREALNEVENAEPEENGVDVAARLAAVVEQIENLAPLVESSKLETFKSRYRNVAKQCSQCHADTGYDFIDVKVPEYNPYSNLDMSSGNSGE